MTWTVTEKRSLNKRIRKLPENVQNILIALKKGHPTYVAIWEVTDKEIRLIEVIYAGTHEKAPY